jgi:hypothetical protein
MKKLFVLACAGESHAHRANLALRFLKKFSRTEIVVIAAQGGPPIDHDQVLPFPLLEGVSTERGMMVLKAALPLILGERGTRACYLDTDVVAVSPQVDEIFDAYIAPVVFAQDHLSIDAFSRCAISCGCSGPCTCLRRAIAEKFGMDIPDGQWRHWNGGVYLFGDEAAAFSRLWISYLLMIFADARWHSRDQGALAAVTWRLGLENGAVLPGRFNHIVDCFRHIPESERAKIPVAQLPVACDYSLSQGTNDPVLVHFINNGIGRDGWPNWDEANALLGNSNRASADTFP